MKTTYTIILLLLLDSCGQPTQNKNGNSVSQIASEEVAVEESNEVQSESQEDIEETNLDQKCNGAYVLTIKMNEDNLDTSMISNLLRTIDESCRNNAEFSEFSNEMLFKVIEKRLDLFCESYQRLANEIDTAYILFNLRNPIHDGIPLKSILIKMDEVGDEFIYKQEILGNLKAGYWE